MPLLIRELNIKVNVDQGSPAGNARAAGDDSRNASKSADAQTLQRAIEEVLRIEAAKKER